MTNLAVTTARLAERIQDLEERELIRAHMSAYAMGCDTGDATRVAGLFAPEGILRTSRETVVGRHEIRSWFQDRFGAPSQHLIANVVIGPAVGRHRSVNSDFCAVKHLPTQTSFIWGSYADDVAVDGETVLILSHVITIGGTRDVPGAVP
jgi:SnoaL-like domain